jgi:RNA polymerase sigma-70 factor (ECF subfamily)
LHRIPSGRHDNGNGRRCLLGGSGRFAAARHDDFDLEPYQFGCEAREPVDSALGPARLEGDVSAFENIVRRWQSPLVNLAFRLCRDPQRAEELAQDAFLQIYRQLSKFRGEATFSTWMFAISLNLYRSWLRRRKLPMESIETLAELAGGQLPHLQIEQREREDLIRRAVVALPPRYRDAVIVFYFKEMNLTDTAKILSVPEGTAKAWLHRGRELLRRKLESVVALPANIKEVHL